MSYIPLSLTNNGWQHLVFLVIAVTVWYIATFLCEKCRIVLPFDRSGNCKRCIVLLLLSVGFFLGGQKFFAGAGNSSLLVTIAVGLLIIGLDLFYVFFRSYFVLGKNNLLYTLTIFLGSLFILGASVLVVASLRTPLSEIGGKEHSSGITTDTKRTVAASTLDETFVRHMFTTTGTLFTFIAGTATLIALFYTILQLRAQHTRISTYRQYLRECSRVLNDFLTQAQKDTDHEKRRLHHTPKKNTKNNGSYSADNRNDNRDDEPWEKAKRKCKEKYKVRMVCFTPLNGNVSLKPDSHELRSYQALLERLCENVKEGWIELKVVCLDDYAELEDLRNKNKIDTINSDRKAILSEAAKQGCDLAQLYLGFTDRKSFETDGEALGQAYWDAQVYVDEMREASSDVVRKRRIELPTFHFMLINNVAVVGNPLCLPPSISTPEKTDNSIGRKEEKVEMLGFRTDEPYVVEALEKTFEFFKNSSAENG